MSVLVWAVCIAAAMWCLWYFRVPLGGWAVTIFLALTLWTQSDSIHPFLQVTSWIVFFAVFAPLLILPLRRRLISNHIFSLFKQIMPSMSTTEREALEAGTVWWDGELFSGNPNWRKLLEAPEARLSKAEQAFLQGPVEELCAMLDDWAITTQHHDLSPEAWEFMKKNKFFGLIIPESYGGLGFSAYAHSAVVTKIGSRSGAAAVTAMVPNSIGPAELLLHYGTDEQKNHYLPRLACGDEIPCFALTGPEAGSDASAMTDFGVVCRAEFEGKQDVLGIRLNWEKRYITLGPVATVLGLAFKLYDPDHLIGKTDDLGITVALIPTNTPGVSIGRRHYPLNIPFQNGPNWGKDVFIPMDWIIGGQDRVGQGWRMLMESLAAGRSISLPSLSTGASKLAARATGGYARIRRQFKMPIGRFEGVEEALARIAAYTYQIDATRTITAAAVDNGEKPAVISAIAKYNLTERMRKVINDAMDIQGGSAICMGPRNFIARAYQALPISITVEGANILTRSLIIFGQGAIRCHPYVLKEMHAVQDSDAKRGAKQFDKAFWGHVGFTLSNVARSLFLGLTGARLVRAPVSHSLKRYYAQLTRMSSAFALVSDMSMLALGGSLKRKEKLSGRLADVLSQLYLASAVLAHFQHQGCKKPDEALARWALEDSLYRIQQAINGLLRNYPIRPIAWLLQILVFPFGRTYRLPSDALGHQVAEVLLQPSAARDRLTAGIYIPTHSKEPLARIEDALPKVIAAESVERLLWKAKRDAKLNGNSLDELIDQGIQMGIITSEQGNTVRSAMLARREVITVDDFPNDLNLAHTASTAEIHSIPMKPKVGNVVS